MKRRIFITLFLICTFGFLLKGQKMELDTIPNELQINHSYTLDSGLESNKQLIIINACKDDISFLLSIDKSNWTSYNLKKETNILIDASRIDTYYLKIYTEKRHKSFNLKKSNRYAIVFDTSELMFTLKEIYFD